MARGARDDFQNLLLLCYLHHRTIDGSNWKKYTVETLTGWKSERESSRGSALRTLHDVNYDSLENLIHGAIASRNEQIQETLSRLEQNDAQAAGLLRELSAELADLRGHGSFLDPDVASMLDNAASRLGHLQDTAGWLDDAAQKLGHLPDTASWLEDAVQRLENLRFTVQMLNDAADRLESAAERARGFEGGF
jgi:hypothetical protein